MPVPFGGPLRMRVPRQLGYKSTKYINRLVVTDSLPASGRARVGRRRGWLFLVCGDLRRGTRRAQVGRKSGSLIRYRLLWNDGCQVRYAARIGAGKTLPELMTCAPGLASRPWWCAIRWAKASRAERRSDTVGTTACSGPRSKNGRLTIKPGSIEAPAERQVEPDTRGADSAACIFADGDRRFAAKRTKLHPSVTTHRDAGAITAAQRPSGETVMR